jgi:signal peptidase I
VNFIKRVVAGPGDEIYIKEGHVFRKPAGKREFSPEKDSYIRPCAGISECNFPTPIKVPAGHWFMMGDNRGESDDSRFWGPVPTGWIIGGAFATYWPPDRIGIL